MNAAILFASLLCILSVSAAQDINPVEQELALLRARNDVTFATQSGWTIVTEANGLTIWSFAPSTQAAYPAYVKRWTYKKDGSWLVEMQAQCGGEKAACDALVADFQKLNEKMRMSIEESHRR